MELRRYHGLVMTDITRIMSAAGQGDPCAAKDLLPLVYAELRRLAAQKLVNEQPGQLLDATALVHEAHLRITPLRGLVRDVDTLECAQIAKALLDSNADCRGESLFCRPCVFNHSIFPRKSAKSADRSSSSLAPAGAGCALWRKSAA